MRTKNEKNGKNLQKILGAYTYQVWVNMMENKNAVTKRTRLILMQLRLLRLYGNNILLCLRLICTMNISPIDMGDRGIKILKGVKG